MIRLNTPLTEEDVLKLNTGDFVFISGTIFTARDKAHKFLLDSSFEKLRGSVVCHCGPIIKENAAVAAGPTTSSRMNQFTPAIIEKYGIKGIIGKGGMDSSVLNALKGKAVYLSAIGGAAVLYASHITVKNVYKPEFGMPEAIWEFEVKDFPVIVAMDAKGNSLYKDVCRKSKDVFLKIINANI